MSNIEWVCCWQELQHLVLLLHTTLMLQLLCMEEAQRQVMIIALENSPKKMHALIGEKSRFYNLMQTELARAVDVMMARANLVPRSLVDEAEGEIWRSKKICFS